MSSCTVMTDAYGTTSGCLPHTGLSLWLVAAGALAILALGLLLWWIDRPR